MLYLRHVRKIESFGTLKQYLCGFQLTKLVVLVIFGILRHYDFITILY